MEVVIYGIVAIVVFFILKNGLRNRDPHNRKCAAELCEYLTSTDDINPEKLRQIFMDNARYQKQANHVLSMVPALLINAGCPKNTAMEIVPLLRSVVVSLPQ